MLKPAFIDLSHHNVIPQSLLPTKQSGIVGVIHKITEGTSFTDNKADNRHFLAKRAGLLWGLYHFVRPGNMEEQVNYFLEQAVNLGVMDDKTLLCLDWEDRGVSIDQAAEFLERVHKITDHSPVLYSGHVLKEALNGQPDSRLAQYRLWLAQYASAPTLPPGWTKYWGWQYTDQGTCPGVNPPVDLNAYDGTAAQLRVDWSGTEEESSEIVITITVPPGVKVVVKEE